MKRTSVPGPPYDEGFTPAGKRRKHLYVEGSRLLGGLVIDLLAKFRLGTLYSSIFQNEGMKLMSAAERWGRDPRLFDVQKGVLKAAFLIGIAPCLPVFGQAYDELAGRVFAEVDPLLGITGDGARAPGAQVGETLGGASPAERRDTDKSAAEPPGNSQVQVRDDP